MSCADDVILMRVALDARLADWVAWQQARGCPAPSLIEPIEPYFSHAAQAELTDTELKSMFCVVAVPQLLFCLLFFFMSTWSYIASYRDTVRGWATLVSSCSTRCVCSAMASIIFFSSLRARAWIHSQSQLACRPRSYLRACRSQHTSRGCSLCCCRCVRLPAMNVTSCSV